MKKISLGKLSGKGKYVMVDDEDFEYLNQFKWYIKVAPYTSYALRHKRYSEISMHRLIMQAPKGMEIDHIDGNGLNNQKLNLRICTTSENQLNTRRNKRRNSNFSYTF